LPKSIIISGPPAIGKTTVAKGLAKEFGIAFWECSAKNDVNVEPAFISIARAVKDRLVADGQAPVPGGGKKVDLKATQAAQNKKQCC